MIEVKSNIYYNDKICFQNITEKLKLVIVKKGSL